VKGSIRDIAFCLLLVFNSIGCSKKASYFRFTLTGDPRAGLPEWRHSLEQIKANAEAEGPFAFHITAGDYWDDDPPSSVAQFYAVMQEVLGKDVKWYPGVGNHELKKGNNDLQWLQQYYDKHLSGGVNPGPKGCEKTMYSWDYGTAHFVQLDMYYDGRRYDKDGTFNDHLYDWLVEDLNKNTKPVVFVIYHEPTYPKGRGGKRSSPHGWRRFMKLLNDKKVVAGLCAHTHTYARYQVKGDWQPFTWELDAGNAGRTSHGDKHQSFVAVTVYDDGLVRFDTWQGKKGEDFEKRDSWSVRVTIPQPVSVSGQIKSKV